MYYRLISILQLVKIELFFVQKVGFNIVWYLKRSFTIIMQEKSDEIGRTLFNLSNYSFQDVARLVYGRIIESLPQAIVFYALYGLWVLFVALISWIFNFQPQDMLDNIILYIWNQFIDAISN